MNIVHILTWSLIIAIGLGMFYFSFFIYDIYDSGKKLQSHIKQECGKMFPYTNSTFDKYNDCLRHHEYYGVDG